MASPCSRRCRRAASRRSASSSPAGHGGLRGAGHAQGAYDYIEKPLNAEKLNRLKALIPKALDKFNDRQKIKELASTIEGLTHYGELTGQSESMRACTASSTRSRLVGERLILGESGTARSWSPRDSQQERSREGPILRAELRRAPEGHSRERAVRHEKGAFTGSTNEKAGAFEMANGGTIFLDEVAEMAPDIQVKLLRALESRSIRRLGGKTRDLSGHSRRRRDEQEPAEGHRRRRAARGPLLPLAVVEIFLPPLRERLGDVKLLANEFLARYAQQNGKKVAGFENDAWSWILNYRWPGNVRELKNAVERAVIMSTGPMITVTDIAPRHLRPGAEGVDASAPSSPPRRRASDRMAAAGGENGSAMVLGMTRDELFEAFSRFLSTRAESKAAPAATVAEAVIDEVDDGAEPDEGVIADRGQMPAKAHAKAKTKKRR
jgi:DNA-binding NtrC family response regulator